MPSGIYKRKPFTKEHKRNIGKSSKGRKVSIETRQKIGKSSRGKKHSEETKKKISKARIGIVPWNKGVPTPNKTKKKIGKAQIGNKNHNWKGGIKKEDGRIYILALNHPNINRRYIARSRLVAEKCLGRYLTKKEIIHHINEVKYDDRLENLYLFPSHSEHTTHHNLKNKPKLESNLKKSPKDQN